MKGSQRFLNVVSLHRFADDRPSVEELQAHGFFKQCRRTSLAENLSLTAIDKYNCTKLANGEWRLRHFIFLATQLLSECVQNQRL